MNEKIRFYGYRGNIEFKDATIFNCDLIGNSEYKNKLFTKFFNDLKKEKLKSSYDVREYILLYVKDISDSIIHCQLARKRNTSIYQLKDEKINELKSEDYPYVNVFVEIKSQKFLIESNSKVYENPETCKKTIENIMRTDLNESDAFIVINPITEEEKFWEKVENNDVYSITFKLNTPNWLDSKNSATELMSDIRRNTGADYAKLEFSTSNGSLELNKEGIESFLEYSTEGAGQWSMRYRDRKTGEKKYARSNRRGKSIIINFENDLFDERKNNLTTKIIQDAFDIIEKFEQFKGVEK